MEDFLGMKKKRSNERYHMCRHRHTDHTPPRTSSIPVLPIMTNKDGRTPALPPICQGRGMYELSYSYPDHHDVSIEPPLAVHQQYIITHVHNHGACPKLTWDDHRVRVGGDSKLVPNKLDLSMDDLVKMEPRELPVTLVCAVNRRKE